MTWLLLAAAVENVALLGRILCKVRKFFRRPAVYIFRPQAQKRENPLVVDVLAPKCYSTKYHFR